MGNNRELLKFFCIMFKIEVKMKRLFGLKDENGKDVIININETNNLIIEKSFDQFEYETNLIKLANEKGLTRIGARVKDAHDGLVSIITGDAVEYRGGSYDSLVIKSNGIEHFYAITNLYYKGVWATVVSDKKKCPKTKEEIKQMYYDWLGSKTGLAFDDYIDKFED